MWVGILEQTNRGFFHPWSAEIPENRAATHLPKFLVESLATLPGPLAQDGCVWWLHGAVHECKNSQIRFEHPISTNQTHHHDCFMNAQNCQQLGNRFLCNTCIYANINTYIYIYMYIYT